MALTDLGYERPTFEDLMSAQKERAKLLFGNDIDTSDNAPLGKYIRLNVQDLADVYEDCEKVYYARFPNYTSGVSLDRLAVFAGISRNPATYARHNIRFTGVAGEYVPASFEVSANDGALVYHTYDPLLIGVSGYVDGVVECETAGEIGNVAVGKIDTIVNPDINVESITHLSVASYGTEVETDTELRDRFNATIAGAGSATAESIKGAISRVENVDGVAVVENDTDSTVGGIPPHSFECYVLSPDSQDTLVAEAIWSKKPIGIKAVGDVAVDIVDQSGVTHTVNFSRTIQKDIYIRATINTNNYFETDGVEQIKNYIAAYINTLKNGEEVYLSSIYPCIYKAAGIVNVSSLTMSTDGSSYSANNITVNDNEVARIDINNIEVTIDG